MLLCTDAFVKLLQCTLYGIELLSFAMHSIVENFKSQNTAQKSLPPPGVCISYLSQEYLNIFCCIRD